MVRMGALAGEWGMEGHTAIALGCFPEVDGKSLMLKKHFGHRTWGTQAGYELEAPSQNLKVLCKLPGDKNNQ